MLRVTEGDIDQAFQEIIQIEGISKEKEVKEEGNALPL